MCGAVLCATSFLSKAVDRPGLPAVGNEGKALNLGFEDGTLKDWKADGSAFDRQPMRGNTVTTRRADMESGHSGDYWVGTYERGGDELQGTLTSVPFKVTQPFASFLVSGGINSATRVELVRADTQKVFFKISGTDSETLRPVVVEVKEHLGQSIFIRVVDQHSGPWGHINFDDFKFHKVQPVLANEIKLGKSPASMPEVDAVMFAGLSPEEAASSATVLPGFKMHLFAGEPDVKQPIAFALDHRGRMWVAEAYTYPRRAPEGQGKDRILIFEDTTGDGKFDKRTVFIEGLNLVSGLEVGFGGVWVGAAPYLMFIADKDGDDKPDGAPQILLDGFAYQDTHETLNTFTWGPDGWLYGCHGVFTHSNVGRPGSSDKERTRINAGVFRYHPTQHKFEVFAEGTSNPWGVDFDEYGQCLIEACVIPHFYHMIHGGRYERQAGQHFNPNIYDDIKTIADHRHYAGDKGPHAGNGRSDTMGGGHAHAGLMMYLGDSWPAEYRNKAFMNNIHGQRLNMDVLEAKGSGYVGKHGPDFVNFNDRWSQVLNMQYDQNGSVYMIDWYDKNQCHHNDPNGHDRDNGRIFKLVYNETKSLPVDLQKKTDAELVTLQLHRNEWLVRHARRVLQERGGNAAVHAGLRKIIDSNSDVTRQLRALWALHGTAGLTEEYAQKLLQRPQPYVRAWTLQLLAQDKPLSEAILAQCAAMAKQDSSPIVRLYLASAMQRTSPEKRWPVLKALLAHAEDTEDHNLPFLYWYAAEASVAEDPTQGVKLLAETKIPRVREFITRRVVGAGRNVAATNPTEPVAQIVALLGKSSDIPFQLDVLRGLTEAMKGQRSVAMPEGWIIVEEKLLTSSNAEVRTRVQALSLTFGSLRALASLRKIVSDVSALVETRRSALESLLAVKDPELPPVLQTLLKDASMRVPALRGLANYDDPKSATAILAVYPSLAVGEKRDALATLASRLNYARPLLLALTQGQVAKGDLTADLVRQLRNLKNNELSKQLDQAWGTMRDSTVDQKAEIEKYTKVYLAGGSQPGDASRGRLLFSKTCQQCHVLFETGGQVGPNLTGSNRGDLPYILQNIVDPNAVIPNDYRTSTLETKDDRVITGIVKQQDEKSVTILTPTESLVIPRNEVKSIVLSEISMMPEGLLTQFKEQEVRDLLYYLSRPAQVPLPKE